MCTIAIYVPEKRWFTTFFKLVSLLGNTPECLANKRPYELLTNACAVNQPELKRN